MSISEPSRPNCLYRYFDHAGRLIYIGVTRRGVQRQLEHNATSDWFQYATRQDIEQCPTPEEMIRLERDLIKAYKPPFNKVHNENWEPIRAAYLALVAAEEGLEKAKAGEVEPAPMRLCGHCFTCLTYGEDMDPDDRCYLYGLREEGDEDDPCPHCGSNECLFGAGMAEAQPDAWRVGWDAGWDKGYSKAKDRNIGAILAANALVKVVDDGPRAPYGSVNYSPKGRDESLRALADLLSTVGLDVALEQIAARDPWASPADI